MRVTITGGTGRLGSLLVNRLRERGDEVTILSRTRGAVRWDASTGPAPAEALAGRDAVVHLAGEDIAQRWNDDALKRMRESRERGTRNLVEGLRAAEPRPKVLVSSSAVGYYGSRHDPVDEDAPPGDDVLAGICVAWEREAERAEGLGMRVVRVRTGVVLDRHGGALKKMLLPFKLGGGGPIGNGKQWMSWVDRDDVIRFFEWAIDHEPARGLFNVTAPAPVRNAEFARELGRALHRPALLPAPAFALRLALGAEMANEILLAGQRVLPHRASAEGFTFERPTLDDALAHMRL